MAEVTGPISTLPGSMRCAPDGAMCDDHPDVPAVARVQGETDSFGSEMHDLCQACLNEMRTGEAQRATEVETCDWCKARTTGLCDTRDYDEGMSGPVYRVCAPCRKRTNDEAREELDRYDRQYPFDDDY